MKRFLLATAISLCATAALAEKRERLLELVRALTRGPLRFRLEWPTGKRRSQTKQITSQVAERTSGELSDDPRASAWTVLLSDDGARALVTPHVPDPRFAYRVGDVPAASHPTIAAALAREADPGQYVPHRGPVHGPRPSHDWCQGRTRDISAKNFASPRRRIIHDPGPLHHARATVSRGAPYFTP